MFLALMYGATFAGLMAWQLAGSILGVNGLRIGAGRSGLPDKVLLVPKTVFHEIRPFYWYLLLANVWPVIVWGEGPAWVLAHIVLFGVGWFLYKDVDNDDDRWKRRRKKV